MAISDGQGPKKLDLLRSENFPEQSACYVTFNYAYKFS
jgi:hypothetical protein